MSFSVLGASAAAGASLLDLIGSAGTSIAREASAYPLAAAVLTLGAYEIFGDDSSSPAPVTNNPPNLGQRVDTRA
ncbi:hypothetical protein [Paludibacterium yongneupense]|uniref:hypothetical protein n=1 Tax=Paludibacterium yongneupense TaxID=400061 RepID=UPI000425B497|nr:hypothetical protein [Paludibacterium yongneupense]